MKKLLLLILAVFSFTFANAQGFKMGIKGGWNYSSVSGGDKDVFGDPDYKNSYHFGIMPAFEFGGMLSLRPEILYTSKGYQLNTLTNFTDGAGQSFKIDTENKTNLNYISVPLLVDINAGPVFFELGPEFAYMVAVTQELKIDKRNAADDKIVDSKKETHKEKDELGLSSFDFGYVAGIGVNLPAGFGLGLRYNGGFTSIFDDDAHKDVTVRNSVFMLSLNYTIGGHSDK